ncbi:MAG: hypothetical protein HY319_11485 [Armatimonadetes bacterium]|nr:hypothetical protein [Armatimonadota bacterium]
MKQGFGSGDPGRALQHNFMDNRSTVQSARLYYARTAAPYPKPPAFNGLTGDPEFLEDLQNRLRTTLELLSTAWTWITGPKVPRSGTSPRLRNRKKFTFGRDTTSVQARAKRPFGAGGSAPTAAFPPQKVFIPPMPTPMTPFPPRPAAQAPAAPGSPSPATPSAPPQPFGPPQQLRPPLPGPFGPPAGARAGFSGAKLGPAYGAPQGSASGMKWGWRDMAGAGQTEQKVTVPFTHLSLQQRRRFSSVGPRDQAVLQLWGLQMGTAGMQNGGVYFNILGQPAQFPPPMVERVREFQAAELENFQGVTGKALDREFFSFYHKVVGKDLSPQYGSSPAQFAQGPVQAGQMAASPLSAMERGLLRMWGRQSLFGMGLFGGNILPYPLTTPTATRPCLDVRESMALVTADLASYSSDAPYSLEEEFHGMLAKLYQASATTEPRPADPARAAASRLRPLGTSFPEDGDANRYQYMAQALGTELRVFDERLQMISRLSRTTPQASHLEGRFEYGLFLRLPEDPREFSSYLACFKRSDRNISQTQALPGTRFWEARDAHLWQAATARAYCFQIAAFLRGFSPVSPRGLSEGARALLTVAPDARIFTQIGALYVGGVMGGPAYFDNRRFGDLLRLRGLADLAGQPGVGHSDLETMAAVSFAMERGALTFNDVLACGAVADLERFQELLGYVADGSFNYDLGLYDLIPLGQGEGSAFAGGIGSFTAVEVASSGQGEASRPPLLENPHAERLAILLADPVVRAHYALFDLDGDGLVSGPEVAAALSTLHDLLNLMLSGASPYPTTPAVLRNYFRHHDCDKDGKYTKEEIRHLLHDLMPVVEAILLDQYAGGANTGVPVTYGPMPSHDTSRLSQCPVLGPMMRQ